MTDTVESKYELYFWAKNIMGIIVAVCFIFLFFRQDLQDPNPDHIFRTNRIITVLVILVPFVFLLILFPPIKILVSADNIIFHKYIGGKESVILYEDIDKIRTVRKKLYIKGGGVTSYQQLQLELNSGELFLIDENDYTNYESLKLAIYDHKLRGK